MRDVSFDWSIKILIKVALYLWDTKNEKWEKPEVEGTLFVYRFVYYFIFKLMYFFNIFYNFQNEKFSRSVSPKYGFTIMNRLSIGTFNHLLEKSNLRRGWNCPNRL